MKENLSSERLVWFKGDIRPLDTFRIPVNDLALLRGFGIFDYFRTYNGIPFRLQDHLDRFFRSAVAMGMPAEPDAKGLASAIASLKETHAHAETGFRILLTGGFSLDSMQSPSPNLFILAEPLPPLVESHFVHGVALMLSEYEREIPEVKTVNYLQSIRLLPERRKRGEYEVLYHGRQGITEASRSNFFMVRESTLYTAGESVLKGITRKVVMELAAMLNIPLKEEKLTVEDLYDADEAFLTGTNTRVMPVIKVGDQAIGKGKPGPVTQRLMEAFQAYTAGWN